MLIVVYIASLNYPVQIILLLGHFLKWTNKDRYTLSTGGQSSFLLTCVVGDAECRTGSEPSASPVSRPDGSRLHAVKQIKDGLAARLAWVRLTSMELDGEVWLVKTSRMMVACSNVNYQQMIWILSTIAWVV